jgi:hypothetical protein
MPQTVETTVYRLEELSEAAREQARAWYREHALDPDWYDTVYEDFERICAILGVELATRPVRLFGGGQRQKPCIWFSGFWSQGEGASFDGFFYHARGFAANIRSYAPMDAELHEIADALQAIQRRNFYQLLATIAQRGRYCHASNMAISVERDSPTGQDVTADAEDAVIEAMRDLARWLYRQLEREYDYIISDEAVDEAITVNEYTFTETGRRFG